MGGWKEYEGLVFDGVKVGKKIGNGWREKYTFHIEISWWIFVVAGVLALGIAFLTIGFQRVKEALMNPVKSLRSE